MFSCTFDRIRGAFKGLRPGLEALEVRDIPATWGFAWPLPQIMTISFVPDGTQVGTRASDLSAYATATWGSNWEREALRALQAWVPNAQINVGIHADDGEPLGAPGLRQGSNNFGDIRVAAVPMSNDVIASSIPFEPAAGTWSGDVLLNSARSGQAIGAYPVFLHEFGHIFGFPDNYDPTSVNYQYFNGQRSDLSAPDIAALQLLYGARQPDSQEGPTGNDSSATATALAFMPGQASQTLAADLTTSSDVDDYQVTLPAGSNELKVRLKTSGLSLLVGSVTIFDSNGAVVTSATATDPRSGDLIVLLAQASPGQTYRISIRAADPAFAVGQYAISIDTDESQNSVPKNTFIEKYGSTYLLSILSDGVSSNRSEFQDILRILFSGGGDSSLYSDNVMQGLDDYLVKASSTPKATRSLGTLLAQILGAQGSSQLDPDQFGAVLDQLKSSGLVEQLIAGMVKAGSIDQIVQALISSGQVEAVFRNLIDSGAFATMLGGVLSSPQGPALLDDISSILRQAFLSKLEADGGQAGPSVLTAQNMLDFYRVLLDAHELDPVIDSFLDSGLLYNSFASVPQAALERSNLITLGLAARPDHLGAELRQFFWQAGLTAPTGPVTPQDGVNMIRALRSTDFFDEYYRALLDAGGLDEISAQLAASGALDQVFANYLTSDQVSGLIGVMVGTDKSPTLLPILAQTGILDGLMRSAIGSGTIGPLLAGLGKSGALQSLTTTLLDAGMMGPLIQALTQSVNFSDVLNQLFLSGQFQPIAETLASSGALAAAINRLVGSGQFTTIIDKLLSAGTPEVAEALNALAMQLLPTPATSFDDAIPLASATASGSSDVRSLSSVGVIGNTSPLGYYKLVVPTIATGAPKTMIVGVWRNKDTLVRPEIFIYDEQRRPVASQLLSNDDGDYVVQVLNPLPGQVYYVMVRAAATVGNSTLGIYGIQAIFNGDSVQMDEITSQTIGAGVQQVETTFIATDSRVYHWVLTPGPGISGDASGGVTLTILDSSGRVVQTLQAPAGRGVSIDLLLDQGTYSLVFSRQGQATSTTSVLGFTLSGFELSDLMKPYLTDTSLQPSGSYTGPGPQPAAGEPATSAGKVPGIARVAATSHSFLATFGNQGGIGDVGVTIARGPGGPLYAPLAAQGRGNQADGGTPRSEERMMAATEDGRGTVAQIDTQGAALPESAAPTWPNLREAAQLAGSGTGIAGDLQLGTGRVVSSLPQVDPDSLGGGPRLLSGRVHPHFLAGMFLIGGTVVARKLRKKREHAPGRGETRVTAKANGTPAGPGKDRRSRMAGRPFPRRVLIVGPSALPSRDGRDLFRGWLVEEGVEVIDTDRADWGEIVSRRPDMVLIEHNPPDIDALEALVRWRARPESRAIPVILVHGIDASISARGLDLGAFDVLSKSVDADEFRSRLCSVMRLSDRLSNLECEASRDGLTGLANRSAFEARLARDWAACQRDDQPLSLMRFDIDNFKNINDSLGHATGDEVLRRVASALSQVLRSCDMAARHGGDEFVILAPGCDQAGAELMAERIRRKIENIAFDGFSGTNRVTVSVGISSVGRPDLTDPEDALHRADLALYRAKSAGRNAVKSWEDAPDPDLAPYLLEHCQAQGQVLAMRAGDR